MQGSFLERIVANASQASEGRQVATTGMLWWQRALYGRAIRGDVRAQHSIERAGEDGDWYPRNDDGTIKTARQILADITAIRGVQNVQHGYSGRDTVPAGERRHPERVGCGGCKRVIIRRVERYCVSCLEFICQRCGTPAVARDDGCAHKKPAVGVRP